MIAKPFKTIDEQIAILESRGLSVGETGYDILLAENYYSIINGYKEPFIDRDLSRSSNVEIYKEGTSIEDIYALFCFDRELRETCFCYLLRIEARVRSVLAYTFCEVHPETMAYLNENNYTKPDEYMPGKRYYSDNLEKLIEGLKSKAMYDQPCKPFIAHYRNDYGEVPLWVLVNDLTFGNISHFFDLLPRSIQNTICKRIVDLRHSNEKIFLVPYDMRLILRSLVSFRNICAHDDRLYCAKVGQVKDIGFFQMLNSLNTLLPQIDVRELQRRIAVLVEEYSNKSKCVAKVLNENGFKA